MKSFATLTQVRYSHFLLLFLTVGRTVYTYTIILSSNLTLSCLKLRILWHFSNTASKVNFGSCSSLVRLGDQISTFILEVNHCPKIKHFNVSGHMFFQLKFFTSAIDTTRVSNKIFVVLFVRFKCYQRVWNMELLSMKILEKIKFHQT